MGPCPEIIQPCLYATPHSYQESIVQIQFRRLISIFFCLFNHWNDLLSRRGPDHAEDKNEFKDGLLALRALCLRSFSEFLADLKMGATVRGSDTSTKLVNFTASVSIFVSLSRDSCRYLLHQTVKYIEKIPHVRTAIQSSLYALGDGNWKMGEGIQVGKGVKTEEADHPSFCS
jgi:exocyst complex component 7